MGGDEASQALLDRELEQLLSEIALVAIDDLTYHGYLKKRAMFIGKRLHNYGKSPLLMGKSSINGPCSIANCCDVHGTMMDNDYWD